MKQQILECARELFFQHGYSRIRIDEIANDLGISKKTFYHYFESKEQLLYEVIDYTVEGFNRQIDAIESDRALPFEEKVKKMLTITGMYSTRILVLVEDLRRNLPEAYQKLVEIKKHLVLNNGMRILNDGIAKGVIRDDPRVGLSLYMFMATAEKALLQSFRDSMPYEITKDLPDSHEAMLKAIVEIIYHGIKKIEP